MHDHDYLRPMVPFLIQLLACQDTEFVSCAVSAIRAIKAGEDGKVHILCYHMVMASKDLSREDKRLLPQVYRVLGNLSESTMLKERVYQLAKKSLASCDISPHEAHAKRLLAKKAAEKAAAEKQHKQHKQHASDVRGLAVAPAS